MDRVSIKCMMCGEALTNMKICERDQVAIPKELKERFGLLPNMQVEFVADDQGIRGQKSRPRKSNVMDVFGILKRPGKTNDTSYLDRVDGLDAIPCPGTYLRSNMADNPIAMVPESLSHFEIRTYPEMERSWGSKPIGKVANNRPFLQRLAENNFT
jgi:bifunctional DNA-binding transcriptional regulator/antitoxin component of YhaV-PrlF toxin-antitoxin module